MLKVIISVLVVLVLVVLVVLLVVLLLLVHNLNIYIVSQPDYPMTLRAVVTGSQLMLFSSGCRVFFLPKSDTVVSGLSCRIMGDTGELCT